MGHSVENFVVVVAFSWEMGWISVSSYSGSAHYRLLAVSLFTFVGVSMIPWRLSFLVSYVG